MSAHAVVSGAATVLAHAPGLVRHGSKPQRELLRDSTLTERLTSRLRTFEDAVAYAPHQAFLGALHPRSLPTRPWTSAAASGGTRFARAGEVMPEEEFLALTAALDEFGLIALHPEFVTRAASLLEGHPRAARLPLARLAAVQTDVGAVLREERSIQLELRSGEPVGAMRAAHGSDDALRAEVLLENVTCKATATLALLHLLESTGADPASIDYVIACGEEAVGDRYQRGGGNMGKAVAEAAGLLEASGADVKNFCAAPIPALVIAASLVAAGTFERVAVVAGGSLPKLGMKFEGHLRHNLPVLEDVIAGAAALVERDDGSSPRIRLDAVGRHRVRCGSSNPQIMEALAVEPLDRVGLKMRDVDDYATELHNPEITEPQGSGDVADRNYRTIAALAVRRGEIARDEVTAFVTERGMPGYAPTQGHLASAVCYLPHALDRLSASGSGGAERVMMLAKGSLFLGRMSQSSDGMSVLLERNPGGG